MTEANEYRIAATADLELCAREPIHIPEAIQPFGMLLFVGLDDFRIRRASKNVDEAWERSIIGRSLTDLFDGPTAERLTGWLESTRERPATAAEFDVHVGEGMRTYRPIAHRMEDGWVLELEQTPDDRPESIAGVLHRAIDLLQDSESIDALVKAAVNEIRVVTGFDSVMIYQFDADWHGRVVAQSRADHMESYDGHHFPASDIPKQARRLYMVNLSRLIVDVDYTPVPIEPELVDATPIDLTHSVLRSVSPVHIEYLQNMGVKASMSFSIVADGRLWGLIACHHPTPRHVPIDTRIACELMARVMSMLISDLKEIEGRTHSARLLSKHTTLLEAMLRHEDFADGLLEKHAAFLAIADAPGAAIVRGETCVVVGQTPPEKRVLEIAAWLVREKRNEATFSSEALAMQYEGASDLGATAAGLLAVPLSSYDSSFLFWFRPELPRSIEWAGEPEKAVRVDGEGKGRIHPRKSFETWREVQRGRSKPWRGAEQEAANLLRSAVTDVVMSRAEEVRKLNASLAEVNEQLVQRNRELRDIADITAHDLQEPLRKIRSFTDLLEKEDDQAISRDGRMYLDRLAAAAKRMSALVSGMLSFSSVLVDGRPMKRVDLNTELRDVVEEFRQLGTLAGSDVTTGDLPVIEGDPSQMRQLFWNLIENAVKFRHPERSPKIQVSRQPLADRPSLVRIVVADNGIGIDERYVESIFDPFHQLHRRERFQGTGMGLAVCRRIVEGHGGTISAESEVGEGTRILIDLPKAT